MTLILEKFGMTTSFLPRSLPTVFYAKPQKVSRKMKKKTGGSARPHLQQGQKLTIPIETEIGFIYNGTEKRVWQRKYALHRLGSGWRK